MTASPAQRLAALPPDERRAQIDALGPAGAEALMRSWRFWARPEQIAPGGEWTHLAVKAGRGWGKGRTAAEWLLERCERFASAGMQQRIGLLNATFDEVRSTQIDGEYALRKVAERRGHHLEHAKTSHEGAIWIQDPDAAPGYRYHLPALLELRTADKPDSPRGRNWHTLWTDELGSWRHYVDAQGSSAMDNAVLALRAICPPGEQPQAIHTFTPKPIPSIRTLMAGGYGPVAVTGGPLYDNAVNLAPTYVDLILTSYEGTRLGQQEVWGQMLESAEGALWKPPWLESSRLSSVPPEGFQRVVVGVDPPGEQKTECGIVVAGLAYPDGHPHLYVLDDSSIAGPPEVWAEQAIAAYRRWSCSSMAVEVNHGGDMCRDVIHVRDGAVSIHKVRASVGKEVRAEPVAQLWALPVPRAHLVGHLGMLEAEMTTWEPGSTLPSPNRIDALVWAAAELLPSLTAAAQTRAHSIDHIRID